MPQSPAWPPLCPVVVIQVCRKGAPVNMPEWRSQWHLVLLNSLTCGLEICVAAATTYVPPLLLEAGVEERYMTMVLGIGPVLSLFFSPFVGSASDKCNSRYGRRRPFIWLLSLGVLIALFIIPNADILASHLFWGGQRLQLGFMILGVGLLDFCGHVCFTPLEALLSDLYREEEECGQAFAMFSFMVSLGGCVGYMLPTLDWSGSVLSVYLGGQADCLFFLLILIFVSSLIITMKVSEEPSCASNTLTVSSSLLDSRAAMESGRCGFPRFCCYFFKLRISKSGPLLCLLRTCWSIYRSYCHVPHVMKQLCVAQLCSWMAVMSFVLFYTDFIGEGLYGGVPYAAPGSASRQRYDEGIRMGSLGLFMQCATSTVFSLIMSRLVQRFGSRRVYVSSMVSFTLSALVISVSKSVVLVTAMAALTGFAYATLQTLPYTLTCHYHKEKEIYMPKRTAKKMQTKCITINRESYLTCVEVESSLHHQKGVLLGQDTHEFFPSTASTNDSAHALSSSEQQDDTEADFEKRGVGLDFAILDSAFLISQVILTLFMGMIVQFAQSVTAYMACAAIFGALAIYFSGRIVYDQKDLSSYNMM
ncbi:solute carrier family 45 member 3 [Eucyclogobius newberryi]|uniref:solute carrier family 45 member 3 n=1 Tax=Eucyclogobius newberryi TaxID=166745 RepID=UPI003B59D370